MQRREEDTAGRGGSGRQGRDLAAGPREARASGKDLEAQMGGSGTGDPGGSQGLKQPPTGIPPAQHLGAGAYRCRPSPSDLWAEGISPESLPGLLASLMLGQVGVMAPRGDQLSSPAVSLSALPTSLPGSASPTARQPRPADPGALVPRREEGVVSKPRFHPLQPGKPGGRQAGAAPGRRWAGAGGLEGGRARGQRPGGAGRQGEHRQVRPGGQGQAVVL